MKPMLSALLAVSLSMGPGLSAAETIDAEMIWKIRRQAVDHSQVMKTLNVLTDRYGPRLTGSPNHEAAAHWVEQQLKEWGLKNVHLEPWNFGHPGWLNQHAAGYLVAPVRDNLTFEVLAWTPSTQGLVQAEAVEMVPPDSPTREELASWLDSIQSKIKGRIVLTGKAAAVPVAFNAPQKRLDDSDALARFDPVRPMASNLRTPAPTPEKGKLTARQLTQAIDDYFATHGVVVRVTDAGREHGQIRAFNNRTFDTAKAAPTVVLRNEDYGRIERLLADGTKVELAFDIANETYPQGTTSYNVVGEIPGTEHPEQVVMLGGHLDSWHSATGATDNAIGCSMMLEAVRILQSLGVKPSRTIRIALWSGEEQGLLGSKAYVEQHFGTFESQKPEYANFDGYLNIDSGTGRVRGATVFGPPEAGTILRELLAPFADLGVVGAATANSRRTGGSDHTSFNAAGLPGISLGQDPIEYGSATWHTNLDTYERVVPEDAVKASEVIAATAWQIANRPRMLPRWNQEQMPKPVPAEP